MRIYVFALLLSSLSLAAAEIETVVNGWLAQQTNVQAWSAEFTQTRSLKALSQPLVSTGQVWFLAPQNFRWELGKNQTIAIRSNETMMVIYPQLKRAEKYDSRIQAGASGRMRSLSFNPASRDREHS